MDNVTDDVAQHRYVITVDGDVAGYIDYHDHGNRRTLIHTEVDGAYEGRGLGSALVRGALEDLRTRGLDLVPECPFVRSYLARHREYVELVPVPDRVRYGLDGEGATT